jgi:hypothetical protein
LDEVVVVVWVTMPTSTTDCPGVRIIQTSAIVPKSDIHQWVNSVDTDEDNRNGGDM